MRPHISSVVAVFRNWPDFAKKAVAVSTLFLLLFSAAFPFAAFGEQTEQLNDEVYRLLTEYHVSGVNQDNFAESDVDTMLEALKDPYTQYFTEQEWESFENQLENRYVGIGVRLGQDNDGFYVNEVFAGSPASAGGLQSGDYIVAVEGSPAADKKLDELVKTITGPEGTVVKLTIERGGKSLEVALTRRQIIVPVWDAILFPEGIGYAKLSDFSSDADEKFATLLTDWQGKGLKSLVFDLRYNPGGRLDTAANLLKSFVESGTLIQTKDRAGNSQNLSVSGGSKLGVPVYLLVNEYSASASEVLTGALQDYKQATVIGAKTFGKGSVQSLFSLENGGVLKMTVEEYLTPNGRKVNGVGLEPDLAVLGDTAQTITALRLAGMNNVLLKQTNRNTEINGKTFSANFQTIKMYGTVYVPSRILAAFVGAEIAWDSATKSVMLTEDGNVRTFPLSGGAMKLENGVSFIDAKAFHQAYAEFTWSNGGEQLILSVNEGN